MMSNGCPCHPQLQCLRPSTLMTLRMSDMLKLEKHRKSCKRCPAQVSWKVKVKCQINSACRSGLSRPFCLPCLYSLSCLPFCGFPFRRQSPPTTFLNRCKVSMVIFVEKLEVVHKKVGCFRISLNLQLAWKLELI